MDFSPTSRRTRRVPATSDIYSTVVVHDDNDERTSTNPKDDEDEDTYTTMVRRNDDPIDDYYGEDDDDDASLPPLLKRLPKDFDAIDGIDDEAASISGTMIVKADRGNRNRSSSPSWNPRSTPLLDRNQARNKIEEDEEGDFSTFVVRSTVRDRDSGERESVSGTVVRKTSGGGGGMGVSTMSMAVASMQAVGELGFGKKQRMGSSASSSQDEEERESVSGTVVRKTSGGGGGMGVSTMSMAVASMQAVGELGFGKKQRMGSGASSSQDEEGRYGHQMSKVSSSSIPECVTREDPSTKYELLNELGKGSYGAVYKARDIRTSEMVAIKVISLSEGEEGYEEIRGEIEMLQQCSHPNVVRYLGSYQGEEYLWIVMEYCGGGSVADLMNVTDESLEEYQIAYICREALKGLSYLHSIFKVHRDIKGGNILLTEQGEVKLGDFGVAAQLTRTMSKRNTIVMEYCGGGSVADLMNVTDESLEEYQIAYICREALKGLSYLHSIFKVHRDIKGGNILLTEQGEVKLGDFGVAAQLTRTMSKRNTFIGTPHWMAPEVIQESRYDGKGKLSVLLTYPVHELYFLRWMCGLWECRQLKWQRSLVFHDFIAKCLTKEPRLRPTASEMLKQKFIERCKSGPSVMLPKIEKAKQIRASMSLQAQNIASGTFIPGEGAMGGPQVNEDYGETLPSRPRDGFQVSNGVPAVTGTQKQSISDAVELAGEGDFGTMIVHTGVEKDKTSCRTPVAEAIEASPGPSHVETPTVSGAGDKSIDPWGRNADVNAESFQNRGSQSIAQTIQASSPSMYASPEQNLKTNSVSQAQVGSGGGFSSGPMKDETVSRKALDKLWSIYAAGNTVPIPFLRATDISPIALLSDNVLGGWQRDTGGTIAEEAIQELFTGDGQSKKGRRGQNEVPLPPSVYQRLTSSSTLMNLTQALAYHKMCYEEMPLQEIQATQEQQTIQNLCDTLRTILRL
ncbi:Serine/threonine-protein kinase [Actinidia chinensis var. chinensis]|uniref:non-specific serine/threonine protein kinase n=1 Tax=Actinidia chinensis var. chinensis TaxID=1590841 RepID=A0A2R6PBI4_ACTCC|nr:Serine/threonine-protein kinase [Actinidia chinensis var. chinensis]